MKFNTEVMNKAHRKALEREVNKSIEEVQRIYNINREDALSLVMSSVSFVTKLENKYLTS